MKERPETQGMNYPMMEKSVRVFFKIFFFFLISIVCIVLLGIIGFFLYGAFRAWGPVNFSIVIAVIAFILLLWAGKVTIPEKIGKIGAYTIIGVLMVSIGFFIIVGIIILSPFFLMCRILEYPFKIPLNLKVQKMIRENDINGLILALRSEDWALRYKAADALEKFKDERVIEPLVQFRAEIEAIDYTCYSKSRSGMCPPWY